MKELTSIVMSCDVHPLSCGIHPLSTICRVTSTPLSCDIQMTRAETARRGMLDWSMEAATPTKAGWRCATKMDGLLCALLVSTVLMPPWCVDSWATQMEVRAIIIIGLQPLILGIRRFTLQYL